MADSKKTESSNRQSEVGNRQSDRIPPARKEPMKMYKNFVGGAFVDAVEGESEPVIAPEPAPVDPPKGAGT